MNPPAKLTKKQRKGLAFRQKGTTQSRDIPEQDGLEPPIEPERLDIQTKSPLGSTGKRKREEDDHSTQSSKKSKAVSPGSDTSKQKKGSARFILFVGNLRYTTTKESIAEHFSKCDPPPTVRLITPKGSGKSKGCAFLEFTHTNALQQGLKFHHSELEGRTLNVELTAGGGGKGEERVKRLRERNKTLNAQRVKQKGAQNQPEGASQTSKTRVQGSRLSLTSGIDQAPEGKKTWSVTGADAKRKRGGKRHSTKSSSQRAPQAYTPTGANAIAVG